MRLGVVDVGSNTVRLMVADGAGTVPLPVHTAKRRLRLAEHIDGSGRISGEAVTLLADAVAAARQEAERWGVTAPFVFATSIVRDAPNRQDVLAAVLRRTGMPLRLMSGGTEAELTFLAARRWMGWRSGPLVLLDIGGGSLEVAFGRSGMPDFAASLPLGAGRLTREHFGRDDPPGPPAVRELRRRVRHELRDVAARIRWEGPRTGVATSRTFQQLARLCGAAPGREGPFVQRGLARRDLRPAIEALAALPTDQRASMPGISRARAGQSLAGALVAHTTMKLIGLDRVVISPWALREGILLTYLEGGEVAWWTPPTDAPHGAAPHAVAGSAGAVPAGWAPVEAEPAHTTPAEEAPDAAGRPREEPGAGRVAVRTG
ncbi:Ppx/GppA family phosphatase [Streptomyces sp. NPDC047108]|uniref:Ppx/GppA phosphatase family protein n=1 Tax=Streptomyces sp. NPDC047108 TaxID=3155025 RepID=UPI0033F3EB74